MIDMGTVKSTVRNGKRVYMAQDAEGRILGCFDRYSTARLVASGVIPTEAGR